MAQHREIIDWGVAVIKKCNKKASDHLSPPISPGRDVRPAAAPRFLKFPLIPAHHILHWQLGVAFAQQRESSPEQTTTREASTRSPKSAWAPPQPWQSTR
jgi:hypothetical protein